MAGPRTHSPGEPLQMRPHDFLEVKQALDHAVQGSTGGEVERLGALEKELLLEPVQAFAPRATTFLLDQISEHQRDLTNSASERFVADWLAGLAAAANRMLSVLRGLEVDRPRMLANLGLTGASLLAEPAYILLAESGRADAHEIVRGATLAVEKEGLDFAAALKRENGAWEAVSKRLAALGHADAAAFFAEPRVYRGRAAEKAIAIGTEFRLHMAALRAGGGGR